MLTLVGAVSTSARPLLGNKQGWLVCLESRAELCRSGCDKCSFSMVPAGGRRGGDGSVLGARGSARRRSANRGRRCAGMPQRGCDHRGGVPGGVGPGARGRALRSGLCKGVAGTKPRRAALMLQCTGCTVTGVQCCWIGVAPNSPVCCDQSRLCLDQAKRCYRSVLATAAYQCSGRSKAHRYSCCTHIQTAISTLIPTSQALFCAPLSVTASPFHGMPIHPSFRQKSRGRSHWHRAQPCPCTHPLDLATLTGVSSALMLSRWSHSRPRRARCHPGFPPLPPPVLRCAPGSAAPRGRPP